MGKAGALQADSVNALILREPAGPWGRANSPVSATKVMWSLWDWKGRLKLSRREKSWPRRTVSRLTPISCVWCSWLFLELCRSTDSSCKAATREEEGTGHAHLQPPGLRHPLWLLSHFREVWGCRGGGWVGRGRGKC